MMSYDELRLMIPDLPLGDEAMTVPWHLFKRYCVSIYQMGFAHAIIGVREAANDGIGKKNCESGETRPGMGEG